MALHKLTKVGPLYDTPYESYYPWVVDMREDTVFPYDWALYTSHDHGAYGSGIMLSVANGDPSVPANWMTYNQALAEGGFDSYQVKPASNPIYNDQSEGTTVETPCVVKVGSEFLLTYHIVELGGGDQFTCLSISNDGVNFSKYTGGEEPTPSKILPNSALHNHTGYFMWGTNVFDSIPYSYTGHSLLIGSLYADSAKWGSNDGKNWALLSAFESSKFGIGLPESYRTSPGTIAWGSMQRLDNGSFVGIGYAKVASTGGDEAPSGLYEITLADDGLTIVRDCELLLSMGEAGSFDSNEIITPCVVEYNGNKVVFYQGADSALINMVGIATCEMQKEPTPALADLIGYDTEQLVDFRGSTVIPSWLTTVADGGAYTEPTVDGLKIYPQWKRNILRATDGFVPDEYDFIEMYIYCKYNARSVLNMCFQQGSTFDNTLENGIGIMSYSSISYRYSLRTRIADTSYDAVTCPYHQYTEEQGYGVRWWPKQKRAQLIGSCGASGNIIDITDGLDTSQTFFPFFWKEGNYETISTIESIRIRYKLSDNTPATFVNPSAIVAGSIVSIPLTKTIDFDATGTGGFALSASGGAVALSLYNGFSSNHVRFSTNRVIAEDETVVLSYDGSGGWKDENNNAVAAYTDFNIVRREVDMAPIINGIDLTNCITAFCGSSLPDKTTGNVSLFQGEASQALSNLSLVNSPEDYGLKNGELKFSGINDYARLNNSKFSGLTEATLAVWVRIYSEKVSKPIIGEVSSDVGTHLALYKFGNEVSPTAYIRDSTPTLFTLRGASARLTNGVHFISVTYNAATDVASLRLDGATIKTDTSAKGSIHEDSAASAADFLLGGRLYPTGLFLEVDILAFAMFDSSLSEERLDSIYAAGPTLNNMVVADDGTELSFNAPILSKVSRFRSGFGFGF